jgi:hypothetical protein
MMYVRNAHLEYAWCCGAYVLSHWLALLVCTATAFNARYRAVSSPTASAVLAESAACTRMHYVHFTACQPCVPAALQGTLSLASRSLVRMHHHSLRQSL